MFDSLRLSVVVAAEALADVIADVAADIAADAVAGQEDQVGD